jgi:hypothetical protein
MLERPGAPEQLVRWEADYGWTRRGYGRVAGKETPLAVPLARLLTTPAAAVACDALVVPVVTGQVNPAVFADLVRLCAQLDKLSRHDISGDAGYGAARGAGRNLPAHRRSRRPAGQDRPPATGHLCPGSHQAPYPREPAGAYQPARATAGAA